MTLQSTLEEMAGLFLPVVFLVLFGIGGDTGDGVRASHLLGGYLITGLCSRPASYILKLCVFLYIFFLDKFILSSLQTLPICLWICLFETGSHSLAQVLTMYSNWSLTYTAMLLPLPPECWDYRTFIFFSPLMIIQP